MHDLKLRDEEMKLEVKYGDFTEPLTKAINALKEVCSVYC